MLASSKKLIKIVKGILVIFVVTGAFKYTINSQFTQSVYMVNNYLASHNPKSMFRVDMFFQKIYTQVNLRSDSSSKISYFADAGPLTHYERVLPDDNKFVNIIKDVFEYSDDPNKPHEYLVYENVMSLGQVSEMDEYLKSKGYKLVKKQLLAYFKYYDENLNRIGSLPYIYVYKHHK